MHHDKWNFFSKRRCKADVKLRRRSHGVTHRSGMDSNFKSIILLEDGGRGCKDRESDDSGRNMEEFLAQAEMQAMNNPDCVPIFWKERGESSIDATLASKIKDTALESGDCSHDERSPKNCLRTSGRR